MAAVLIGPGDQLVEINFAGGGQHHVLRRIAGLLIRPHRIRRKCRDAFLSSQHTVGQGMGTEINAFAEVVGTVGRLVEIHQDFFQNHLLFFEEIIRPQRGPQQIAPQFNHAFQIFGKQKGVIAGNFVASKGVAVGPHVVKFAVHVICRTALGSFENHVLQEVTHAGQFRRPSACEDDIRQ